MNMLDECLLAEKHVTEPKEQGAEPKEQRAEPENQAAEKSAQKSLYLQMLRHLERLHRLLLDVIRGEFESGEKGDLNAVQALLIYNIGDQKLTAGELRGRGFYLGSNVTYNLKKLVAAGFIEQKRSQKDRRSVYIALSEDGKAVCQTIDKLYDRQLSAISVLGGLEVDDLATMNQKMQLLERFWQDQISFKM